MRRSAAGFSLVEVAIATLLMGGVFCAALTAVGATVAGRTIEAQQQAGHGLARDLMAEVLERSYGEGSALGLDDDEIGATTRAAFDDVDDYAGYSESPPAMRDGTRTSATGYTRAVDVVWVQPSNPSVAATADTGVKRITVTVTLDRRVVSELVALRSQGRPSPETRTELPR